MGGADILADADELTHDLALLESLRWARKEFFDRICDESAVKDEDVLATLRLEATYQLAEFFYLLRARGIATTAQMQTLAELHNQYIVDLTKDAAKVARLGLNRERLLDAMFTADTLPRLLHHWAEATGTLDQSNLARFLAALMSAETCRKALVACDKAGFLERIRSPHGAILVRSRGIMEAVFGQCLRELRAHIGKGAERCEQ
jgi:hypothetical protein